MLDNKDTESFYPEGFDYMTFQLCLKENDKWELELWNLNRGELVDYIQLDGKHAFDREYKEIFLKHHDNKNLTDEQLKTKVEELRQQTIRAYELIVQRCGEPLRIYLYGTNLYPETSENSFVWIMAFGDYIYRVFSVNSTNIEISGGTIKRDIISTYHEANQIVADYRRFNSIKSLYEDTKTECDERNEGYEEEKYQLFLQEVPQTEIFGLTSCHIWSVQLSEELRKGEENE